MSRAALAAALLMVPVAAAPQPPGWPESARAMESSVVHVESTGRIVGEGAKALRGTAFCIAEGGYLLTAAHVVEPKAGWAAKPTIKVFTYTERELREPLELDVVVVFADSHTDLALLRAPGKTFEPLPLADSNSVSDDDFIGVLAFGEGRARPYVGWGKVESGFRPDVFGLMDVVLDNLGPSDSGSPLLNADGKVVGVLTKGWERTEGHAETFGVPINRAAPFLSMAGRHHPSTLLEWLKETPELDQMISDLDEALLELKTSWTFTPQMVWGQGGKPERLGVTVRKRLEVGIWPDFVDVRVTPHVRARVAGARRRSEPMAITLPYIKLDIDDLSDKPRSQVEYVEFKQLESKIASKLREHGAPDSTDYESWEAVKLDVHFISHLWLNERNEIQRTEVHHLEP